MSRHDGDGRDWTEEERERQPAPEPATEPAPPQASPAEALASKVGNRAFGQLIGRTPGDGIMPGGVVHPDIASTIATTNGSGHTLEPRTRDRLAPPAGGPARELRAPPQTRAAPPAR